MSTTAIDRKEYRTVNTLIAHIDPERPGFVRLHHTLVTGEV